MSRRYGILCAAIASAVLLVAAIELSSPFGKVIALVGIAVSIGLALLALVRWTD